LVSPPLDKTVPHPKIDKARTERDLKGEKPTPKLVAVGKGARLCRELLVFNKIVFIP
jgi:hypothetical protein